MFTNAWSVIKDQYPIDYVVNPIIIDYNKNWSELEPFRDKFLGIRLIYDSDVDNKLTLFYSLTNSNASL